MSGVDRNIPVMRLSATVAVLAAAVFAAAAPAQESRTALELRLRSIEARLPDVDRLERLERQVAALATSGETAGDAVGEGAGGGDPFSLYQDIQSLQEDLRELRGQIEELQYRARQREQRQRDLYQDLDRRLQALEREVGIVQAPPDDGGDTPETADDADKATDEDEAADPEAVEQAYLAAFDQLKQGRQREAIEGFEAFVETHPDSEYTDNAWYWLGEAHYVERGYDKAQSAFRRVLEDFPDSAKAPGALYKIGVIQDERGDYDDARETLNEVIEKYPEDNAAELARKRLEALEGQ